MMAKLMTVWSLYQNRLQTKAVAGFSKQTLGCQKISALFLASLAPFDAGAAEIHMGQSDGQMDRRLFSFI